MELNKCSITKVTHLKESKIPQQAGLSHLACCSSGSSVWFKRWNSCFVFFPSHWILYIQHHLYPFIFDEHLVCVSWLLSVMLHQVQVQAFLFAALIPLHIFPEVGLLDPVAILPLIFWGPSFLIAVMTVLMYSSPNSRCAFFLESSPQCVIFILLVTVWRSCLWF